MPLIKTKTYADVLHRQGQKEEALAIYKDIYDKTKSREIKKIIDELTTLKKFDDVNVLKLNEFNEVTQKNRYEFEKWLSEF